MPPETCYLLLNLAVLPAWLLLAAAPRWSWTPRLAGGVMPALLAVAYIILIVTGDGGGDFATLAGLRRLFDSPRFLLAGWVHYLAFDLFVGSWQVQDAQRRGMAHGLVLPCLLATLTFGPAGLLLYFALRRIKGAALPPKP